MRNATILWFAILLAMCTIDTTEARDWEVLVATGQGQDFQFLSGNIQAAKGNPINYTEVDHVAIATQELDAFDVLWIGWNGSSHGGTYIRADDAGQIAEYVTAGGIVVSTATDDDGWESDWLPANFDVLNTGDYNLVVTDEGQELFTEPNAVNANALILDERYASIEDGFTMLAWGEGMEGSEAGALEIELGSGLYVFVTLDNRNAGNTQGHLDMMENMLHYALGGANPFAVEPSGKLSTAWGKLKSGGLQ